MLDDLKLTTNGELIYVVRSHAASKRLLTLKEKITTTATAYSGFHSSLLSFLPSSCQRRSVRTGGFLSRWCYGLSSQSLSAL